MRKAYQTDLSDAEWTFLEPHLPVPTATGRPKMHSTREILNAIFYIVRGGCAWRLRLAAIAARLPTMEDRLDGLITNDKFCFTRHSWLDLRPQRRGYPPRKDISRGGNGETKLDGSSHDGQPQRRRPSLGPGISAPAPVGGSGAGGEFKGGGE